MHSIKLQLKLIRKEHNLSQEELAGKIGISRQALIALESGDSLPSLPVIMAILRYFSISFDSLFSGDGWNPFRAITENDLADETGLALYGKSDNRTILMTLRQTQDKLIVEAEVPGVDESDLSVDLGQSHIVILGIKRETKIGDGELLIEDYCSGPVARIMTLPVPINTEHAKAALKNGLLTLVLPKLHPVITRRIEFKGEVSPKKEKNGSK